MTRTARLRALAVGVALVGGAAGLRLGARPEESPRPTVTPERDRPGPDGTPLARAPAPTPRPPRTTPREPDDVERLRAGLADPDPAARVRALEPAAADPGLAVRAVPATIDALKDPSEAVRAAARLALAAAGPEAVEPLISAVREDMKQSGMLSPFGMEVSVTFDGLAEPGAPALAAAVGEPGLSFWATSTLGRLALQGKDLHGAVPPLTALLRSEEPRTVQWAAQSLGSIGAPASSAVPDLARCLGATEVQTRMEAAQALGEIGPAASTALSDLRALTTDANSNVRRKAEEAVRKIEGR